MSDEPNSQRPQSRSFLSNVIWTWVGAATNLASAVLLSPYVIRKLGPDGYGLWIILFSMVGYYSFLDLGLRPALTYFTALFRARGEVGKINTILSTVTVYHAIVTAPLFVLAVVFADQIAARFEIPAVYRPDFLWLLVLSCAAWVLGVNPFSTTLEAYQRFDLSSRIYVSSIVLRYLGTFILLYLGFGLLALMVNYVAVQILGYTLCYLAARSLVKNLRWSFREARVSAMPELFSYGFHSVVVGLGQTMLLHGTPLIILMFGTPADVGYFGFPQRLFQHVTDLVVRAGSVTGSKATELAATNERESMISLARFVNRYCVVLVMPLVIFILVYGYELIYLWIDPEYARISAPLLPVLLLGYAFVTAGQFNSSSILFSLRKNREYGRLLILEGLVSFGAVAVCLPRFGLIGAAWAVTIPMLLIRGLGTAWLFCRSLQFSIATYLHMIYTAPVLTAIPVFALSVLAKRWLPGTTRWELLAAGLLVTALYLTLAAFTCLDVRHRHAFLEKARSVIAGAA